MVYCFFSHFKRNLDKEIVNFISLNKTTPELGDMVAVGSRALAKSVSRSNIVCGFEKTGLWPLCLDVMLSKIVGDQPHSMQRTVLIQPAISISPAADVLLRELNIDPDAARVVHLNTSHLIEMKQCLKAPKAQDTWVHGGCLMTTEAIIKAVKEREDANLEKQRVMAENKKARDIRRSAAVLKKLQVAIKNKEKMERRTMAMEDKQKPTRRKRKRAVHDETEHMVVAGVL
ncbi:hypothetical protein AC1031_016744 [Aphanomyces cochlioides]|nr:hypothetical protein AC1031_016744 [Aphanomyces cochlioides]